MSTASIIIAIVCLLGALVLYAFAMQTIQQKREQRKRLLIALKTRCRTFKFMLNGFPPQFLTKELTLLVQRSMADVCEQLAKLEPSDPTHMQDLQLVSAQMAENQRQTGPSKDVSLETQQQIKDVKIGLEELFHFVDTLEKKQTLPRSHIELYRSQIKHLVLSITVDSYCLHGKQALQSDKTKLAIHYYELALKLLLRENKPSVYETRMQTIREIIEEIRKRLEEEDPQSNLTSQEIAEQEEVQDAWDKFNQKDTLWKKKNIYD
ncbi:hypothetical protein TDB9533_04328 [Thalassocella blandensis]|nr:hypothetical protein TDB9533_04328 [Thalassocella blandensis]